MGSVSPPVVVHPSTISTTMAMANQAKKPTAAASAARNVLNVVLGDILFKTWYPSFYPEELVGREIERLYVCQWCFKYTKEGPPFGAHVVGFLHA